MKNTCPICQNEKFVSLDLVNVPCGQCAKLEDKSKCAQCEGRGYVTIRLRDPRYWFLKGLIYNEPINFQICQECGFMNYAPRWSEEKWKANQAKEDFAMSKLLSNRIKYLQIADFLKAKTHDKEVLEIGCGFGYGASCIPNKNYYGTDYNDKCHTYASRVNNVKIISDEQIKDRKYGLIIANYIIEHILEPDKWLKKLRDVLEDDGLLYIGVPVYMENLQDMRGTGGAEFESIYSILHQNTFTWQSIQNLLHVCGFEIVTATDDVAGKRLICKKAKEKPIVKEPVDELVRRLVTQLQATMFLKDGQKLGEVISTREEAIEKMRQALALCPSYLDAWMTLSIQNASFSNVEKFYEIVLNGRKNLKNTVQFDLHCANILKNWGEPKNITNWVKAAEDMYRQIIKDNKYNIDAHMGLLYLQSIVFLDEKEMLATYDFLMETCPELASQINHYRMLLYCHDGYIRSDKSST